MAPLCARERVRKRTRYLVDCLHFCSVRPIVQNGLFNRLCQLRHELFYICGWTAHTYFWRTKSGWMGWGRNLNLLWTFWITTFCWKGKLRLDRSLHPRCLDGRDPFSRACLQHSQTVIQPCEMFMEEPNNNTAA